jgi:hypothetical protein
MWPWWVALAAAGRITTGPPGFVFASFNNARAKALAEVWGRNQMTIDQQYVHVAARILLSNPRTFAVAAVQEGQPASLSVLICERRPNSHVLRMCLWAANGAELRGECLRQAAVWHAQHLGNSTTLLLTDM